LKVQPSPMVNAGWDNFNQLTECIPGCNAIPNCAINSMTNNCGVCTQCAPGFLLAANGLSCGPCPPTGTYINYEGLCKICPSGCVSCTYDAEYLNHRTVMCDTE